MTYLKDDAYYDDLYDHSTVEECRCIEARCKDDKTWNSKGSYKKMSEEEQKRARGLFTHQILYFTTGERYAKKAETIQRWMLRDQESDRKLNGALEPSVTCPHCQTQMECTSRHLFSNDKDQECVLFFFDCPSCEKRRAIYDDGEEYKPKPILCPVCGTAMTVKHSRKDYIITTINSCPHCNYKEKHIDNLNEKEPTEKIDHNFEKDCHRFCLTEKQGDQYIEDRIKLKELSVLLEEQEEKKKNKHLYDAVAKMKKLTVADLQRLLSPALQKEGYGKLELSNPEIKKEVIVNFTLQDEKSGRTDYESRKYLEKVIERTLEDTNWRLMSDGTSYRLGILSGRLKGLENETDLIELVKIRDKKK